MQIKKTMDYDVFNYLEGNRNVRESHVKRLSRSINKANYLKENPIIVDKDLNIIDGQHRLEAARRLEIPIYYIVSDVSSYEAVHSLNSNMKNWTLRDFVESYARLGKPDYITLVKLSKEYNFGYSVLLSFLSGGKRSHSSERVAREGNLNISTSDEDRLNTYCSLINEVRERYDVLAHRDFVQAYAYVLDRQEDTGFSHKEFMRKIKYFPRPPKYLGIEDNLRLIENIYNHNKHTKRIRLF